MIAVELGHRFGRLAWTGPDGRVEVTTTELNGTDGVLDPVRALPHLFPAFPAGPAGVPESGRSVLLGLPATGGREEELRRAAENVGLEPERVVPDPVAVALHYGAVAEGVDHTVLVCDQGATTLDLSVLAITPDLTVRVVATRGLRLGGDDWDAAIAAELAGRLPEGVAPLLAAEVLRRAVGESDTVAASVPVAGDGWHQVTVDRETLRRAVAPLRERTLTAVAEQLAAADVAVDTVLLAGGLCAMPGRRAEIAELPAASGLTVRCDQPETAVVRGLLALPDFGVLRIVTGPAPRPGRTEVGYVLSDPMPPAPVPGPGPAPEPTSGPTSHPASDPDPRTGRPQPRDPEPDARGGAGVTAGSPAGTGDRPPDPAAPQEPAGAPDPAAPPESGAPPEPRPAEPSSREPARDAEPPTGRRPEPPPGSHPPSEPDATVPPPPPPPAEPGVSPGPHPHSSSTAPPRPADTPPPTDPSAGFAVPVEQLQAIRRGDHLLVLWAWPDGALTARVRWRREDGPAGQGPPDGAALCPRRRYEHDGGFDLAVGRGAVTLTVEALVARTGADTEGAASLLVPAQPPLVEYEPTVRRRLRGRIASVSFVAATPCELPALHIVHCPGRFRPTSPAEGTVVHRMAARRLPAGTPLTVEFPLPATRGPSWLVCFPADPNAGTATDPATDPDPSTGTATDPGTGTSTDPASSTTGSRVDLRPTALHRLRVT